MSADNGWNEWSRHVLAELERLNACSRDMNEKLTKIQVDIGMLKVKAGMWGVIGGCIPVIVMLAISFLNHK
jgi:hypothetical protein